LLPEIGNQIGIRSHLVSIESQMDVDTAVVDSAGHVDCQPALPETNDTPQDRAQHHDDQQISHQVLQQGGTADSARDNEQPHHSRARPGPGFQPGSSQRQSFRSRAGRVVSPKAVIDPHGGVPTAPHFGRSGAPFVRAVSSRHVRGSVSEEGSTGIALTPRRRHKSGGADHTCDHQPQLPGRGKRLCSE
jgi:hypothetical protein